MLPTGCTARSGEMEKEFPSKRPISSNCYTTYYSHTLESRAQTRYAQEVQGWGEPRPCSDGVMQLDAMLPPPPCST
jgi:hypothetical protein